MMPLFSLLLALSLAFVGYRPNSSLLLLLCPVDCPQATEAWEEQEDEKLGSPSL